jgi:peptide/nickel transport system permease protein
MLIRFAKRFLYSILVILGVSAITFMLLHIAGDPAVRLSSPDATPQEIEMFRVANGFDRPIFVQYLDWLWHLLQGDLGVSHRNGRPALEIVLDALPSTLLLIGCALALSAGFGVAFGVLAAVFRGRTLDRLVIAGSVLFQSLPTFWLGIVVILIFSATLRLLPTSGFRGPEYLILPAITLAAFQVGTFARIARSSMLEILDADFVRTARAKGASPFAIVFSHALPNAALPIVTVVGLQLGGLYGGAIVTETVFGWPGVNTVALSAISSGDMPVVQAYVLVVGVLVILTNLLIDSLYVLLDPRTRVGAH